MSYRVYAVLWLLLLLSGAPSAMAQERSAARPDTWRGLTLNVSTPEDAIRVLGKPSGDKAKEKLRIMMVDKWLTAGKHNQKVFRHLTFKNPPGFAEVRLSFLDDKLVMIDLTAGDEDAATWVDPDDLAALFGANFIPQNWHFGKRLPPLSELIGSEPAAAPKDFAELYDMIAVSEKSFILARVDNQTARPMGIFTRGCASCARERNQEKKRRDAGGVLPGQVSFVQLVSRQLEHP